MTQLTQATNELRLNHVFTTLNVFLFALLVGTVTMAKTRIDFDPSLDFSKFKTFAYLELFNLNTIEPNFGGNESEVIY